MRGRLVRTDDSWLLLHQTHSLRSRGGLATRDYLLYGRASVIMTNTVIHRIGSSSLQLHHVPRRISLSMRREWNVVNIIELLLLARKVNSCRPPLEWTRPYSGVATGGPRWARPTLVFILTIWLYKNQLAVLKGFF